MAPGIPGRPTRGQPLRSAQVFSHTPHGAGSFMQKESAMTTAKKKPTAASKAKAFEAFRNKAIERNEKLGRPRPQLVTNEPYVLGEELGFDPAVKISAPTLESIIVMETAMRDNDSWTMMRAIFGGSEAVRIMSFLSNQFEVSEATEIIEGIMFAVIEHFFGEGTGESGFTGLLS